MKDRKRSNLWEASGLFSMPVLAAAYAASCTNIDMAAPAGGNAVPAAFCVGSLTLGAVILVALILRDAR